MQDDRLKRDYNTVENLDDLIEAREERVSAFADDVDGMADIDPEGMARDAVEELTLPHPKTRSEEYGREGINTELMDTPGEKEIGFDWQDSAEEMLPTDPDPSEGMGEDSAIDSLAAIDPTELEGPSPETDTAIAEGERPEDYERDGGEPRRPPQELESAMETDSDEADFSIQDRFGGQVDHETAEWEAEELRRAVEEEERQSKG
ncbi:MAG: hypothetical protein ACYC2Y_09100 [Armatimonadota bacterium]